MDTWLSDTRGQEIAEELLAYGIDYTVKQSCDQYGVTWEEDPEVTPGGNRRRLTRFNRDMMIAWCGGREPDDHFSGDMLIGSPGPSAGVVHPGDIIERIRPGRFRVIRQETATEAI